MAGTGAEVLAKETRTSRLFYGWIIVGACFMVTLTMGETVWAFGVFFKPLEAEFGWSRSMVSSIYSAFLLGYAVSVVVSGRLADRYNGRVTLMVSGILSGLGMSLSGQINSLNELRFFLFVAGLGGGATLSVPASIVQRWFRGRKRAGLALAIVSSGVGVGALIYAPLMNYMVLNYGWRASYLAVGLISFLSISPAALLLKPSPSEADRTAGEPKKSGSPGPKGWSTSRIIRSPAYIGVVFTACSASFSFQILTVHFIPHAMDNGISAAVAASAMGLMGAISVPGRIISGVISERLGWQRVLALSLLCLGACLVLLFYLRSEVMLMSFVLFYGLFHGVRNVAWLGIMGDFFGMGSLGEIIGISAAFTHLASVFAPYLAGAIFDATGSYAVPFLLLIALFLATVVVALIIKKPRVM